MLIKQYKLVKTKKQWALGEEYVLSLSMHTPDGNQWHAALDTNSFNRFKNSSEPYVIKLISSGYQLQ